MWVSTSDFRLLLTRVSSRQLIQRYLVRVVEDGLRLEMAAYDDARAHARADSGAAPITHGMARDESGAPQVTIALLQRINPSLPSPLLFNFLYFSLFPSHVQEQEQAELLQPPSSSTHTPCVGGMCILYDRRGLEYHHIDPRLQVDRPLKPAGLLVVISSQSHLAPCFTPCTECLSLHQRQCRATIDALRVGYTPALPPKHLPLSALSLTTTTTCVPCSFCGAQTHYGRHVGAIYILHASWLHRYEHTSTSTLVAHTVREGPGQRSSPPSSTALCSPGRALFTLLLQPLLAVVTTLSGRGGAGAAALVLAPDVDALAGNALVVCVHCSLLLLISSWCMSKSISTTSNCSCCCHYLLVMQCCLATGLSAVV